MGDPWNVPRTAHAVQWAPQTPSPPSPAHGPPTGPAPSRTQGGRPVRRLAIAVLAVLTLVGLVAWPLALQSADATRPAPKVVVIAGPVGVDTGHYQAAADATARS